MTCLECGSPIPKKRTWLAQGTEFCNFCAEDRAIAALENPEAQAWLRESEAEEAALREASGLTPA